MAALPWRYPETPRRPDRLHCSLVHSQQQKTEPWPRQLKVTWRQPSGENSNTVALSWGACENPLTHPVPLILRILWKKTDTSPPVLQKLWFQSQSTVSRWAQLYLVATTQPPTPTLASSSPKRLRFMCLSSVSITRSHHTQVPVIACHPTCSALNCFPSRPHRPCPHHQTLAGELPSQAWLVPWWLLCSRWGSPAPRCPIH